MVRRCIGLAALLALLAAAGARSDDAGWVVLFNGKDTTGWKLRAEKVVRLKIVDAQGKALSDARKVRIDQKEMAMDARGRFIPGARVEVEDGRKVVLDQEGKRIAGARIVKVGGRDALVDRKGEEIPGARAVTETAPNTSGWVVQNGVLLCSRPHVGNDLVTEQKFTDFELQLEFQVLGNSGVYLQGRYKLQIVDSWASRPAPAKDGKKEMAPDTRHCGAVYGRVAPAKNVARPPGEWQTYHVIFRGVRGDADKVAQKARLTLYWNGEKVIDNAEIDRATAGALDDKLTEAGPLILQGDHGRVAFRNIKVRPLPPR
jgi:hypothetical protein